jgi:hypothetical protein
MSHNEWLEPSVEIVSKFLNENDLTVYSFPETPIKVISEGTGLPQELCMIALTTLRARIEGISGRRARRLARQVYWETVASAQRQENGLTVPPTRKKRHERPLAPSTPELAPPPPPINALDNLRANCLALHRELLRSEGVETGSWRIIEPREPHALVEAVIGTVQVGQAVMLLIKLTEQGVFVDCSDADCGNWHVSIELPE